MPELMQYFTGSWSWLIVGMALLTAELVLPGMFLIWIGLAFVLVGCLQFFIALSFSTALISCIVLSGILVVIAARYIDSPPKRASDHVLNERISGYIGKTYRLDWPIVNGRGQLRIDDTLWQIRGPDLPSGAEVRVHSIDGSQICVSES